MSECTSKKKDMFSKEDKVIASTLVLPRDNKKNESGEKLCTCISKLNELNCVGIAKLEIVSALEFVASSINKSCEINKVAKVV